MTAEGLPHLVGKACLLVSIPLGGLDAGGVSSPAINAVRLKGSWSLMPLMPAGGSADAPLILPAAEPISTIRLQPGSVDTDGSSVSKATEGSATGFLFLGAVLADGVEDLAVSFPCDNEHWGFLSILQMPSRYMIANTCFAAQNMGLSCNSLSPHGLEAEYCLLSEQYRVR